MTAYGKLSSYLATSSDAPQGCLLSPFLFSFNMILEITLLSPGFSEIGLLLGYSLIDLEYMFLFREDADKMHSLLTTSNNNKSMLICGFLPLTVKYCFSNGLRHCSSQ
ncbi:unnamed protein product [Schistosoma spindalis]|nr:unnamed protein product [Schistosoma spindale]